MSDFNHDPILAALTKVTWIENKAMLSTII